MVPKSEFLQRINQNSDLQSFLSGGEFVVFELKGDMWVQNIKDHTPEIAGLIEDESKAKVDEAWEACILLCGEMVRPGARSAKTS